MRILSKRIDVRASLDKYKGMNIGFVPTMGALHEGHLSLVRASKENCDITVVSIFVNPTQFNNPDDLMRYPRNEARDREMLSNLLGDEDILFMPDEKEVYEGEIIPDVSLGNLDQVMEGKFRPGHFRGVVRVVKIFFDVVKPDMAFFGQKDFQQLTIIRAMASQTHPTTEIIGCPILREPNGLAMSSRNERLSKDIRQKASLIYETLRSHSAPAITDSIDSIKNSVISAIDSSGDFKAEYFEIVDDVELTSLMSVSEALPGRNYYGCIAVYAGGVRLIDNMQFSFPVTKG